MKSEFWHQKWTNDDIPFHESEANSLLQAHVERLGLTQGSRVFLPLCGKSRDIAWLLDRGFTVVGAELSELAINTLFADLGIIPQMTCLDEVIHYQANGIDMYVGDIFKVTANMLGNIDAVYDRAALVALPESMRKQYSAHLMKITALAPQLLITFEYQQALMQGPPFSINEAEVKQLYGSGYEFRCIDSQEVKGGLKEKVRAIECAWLLLMPLS